MSSSDNEHPEVMPESTDTSKIFFHRLLPPKYPLLLLSVPYIFDIADPLHPSISSISHHKVTCSPKPTYTPRERSTETLDSIIKENNPEDITVNTNKRIQTLPNDLRPKKRRLLNDAVNISLAPQNPKEHIDTLDPPLLSVNNPSEHLFIVQATETGAESTSISTGSVILIVSQQLQNPTITTDKFIINENTNKISSSSVSSISDEANNNNNNNNTVIDTTSATYPLPSPSASPIHLPSYPPPLSPASPFVNYPDKQLELIQSDNDILQILINNRSLIRSNADLISQLSKNMSSNLRSLLIYKLLQCSDRSFLSTITEHISKSLRFDIISNIPYEINKIVFSFLDFKSLLNAQLVCKNWALAVNKHDFLWIKLILNDELLTDQSVIETELEYQDSLIERYYQIPQRFYSPINKSNDVKHTLSMQCFKPCIYKLIYKKYFLIDKNWNDPRFNPRKICLKAHGENVITCLQFDHERIVTGADDQIINVFDTKTGRKLLHLSGHEGGVWGLKYIGNTLITASTDKTLRLWNLTTGKCIFILKGHTSTVRCLDIIEPKLIGYDEFGKKIMYPKRPVLVSGSRDFNLNLWDLSMINDPLINKRYDLPEWRHPKSVDINDPSWQTETLHTNNEFFIGTLRGHTDSVRSISVYGRHIVSGSYDASVRVWDLETLSCVHTLSGHSSKVYTTAIDPYRQRVLSGSLDATVNVWDLYTGQFLMSLEEHESLVGLIQLSKDYLVTAAADSTLRIWDPVSGACKHTLKGHDGAVTCFQNNNKRIVLGSANLVVWDVRTGHMIRKFNNSQNCNMWQVKFNDKMCISAVQRNGEAWIEVLDFEASNLR